MRYCNCSGSKRPGQRGLGYGHRRTLRCHGSAGRTGVKANNLGYAESDDPSPALHIYQQLPVSSVEPDTHTYPFLLKTIAKLMVFREGERVHCAALKDGFESLVFVQNALVHLYGACGRGESALQMFDKMSDKNLVAWN
ncbi:hypothetical protein BUALT_Bualt06G0066400 [Buddleja alternifolia]|uniref:Pentatricopeptide repeat-containing protein n=1 Tax=Buddleja alternifolia TaxID=168488 RepID=A0AAV6XDF8_9LAMI|nr:hypothetical protein BUALT_Bualt06G0066400 [Buddleja alternifolia]